MNNEIIKRDSIDVGEQPNETGIISREESATRVTYTTESLDLLTAGELRLAWRRQDAYIDSLEKTIRQQEDKIQSLNKNEEKCKLQLSELGLRERMLMRRLVNKEQELQQYAREVSELKSSIGNISNSSNRNVMIDPAVNIIIQKLRQELSITKTKLEDTHNELNAWKFTPDSNTGKRLMAKCRLLYQENEELGRMISSGRLAKLEGELALQKSFIDEVKKSQSEMDELLQDLDEDVEGMQSTIYYLQQELRRLKNEAPQSQCNGIENHPITDEQNNQQRTLVKHNESNRKRTTPQYDVSDKISDVLDSEQPLAKKHLNGVTNSPPT